MTTLAPAEPYVVLLPWPPAALSPNARSKWERIKAVTAYRDECTVLARLERLRYPGRTFPLTAPVTAVLTFILPDQRKRDADNLIARFKPGFDALSLAGVIPGDHIKAFSWTWAVEQGNKRTAGVRVELTGVAG